MLAQLDGRPSYPSEKHWLRFFAPAITPIIQKTLGHKLQLLATGRDNAYTWPTNGEGFDPNEMTIIGASERLPLDVRFTVFPGLKVTLPEFHHEGLQLISEAAVRVQRPRRSRT